MEFLSNIRFVEGHGYGELSEGKSVLTAFLYVYLTNIQLSFSYMRVQKKHWLNGFVYKYTHLDNGSF